MINQLQGLWCSHSNHAQTKAEFMANHIQFRMTALNTILDTQTVQIS